MQHGLLWIIITLGIGVLFSYFHMAQVMYTSRLFDPIPLYIWIPSMILTITSFIYMSVRWIWYEDTDEIVLGMYVLFFTGAILWAPLVIDAVHRNFKSISVLIVLWLSAFGSIGLFVKSCSTGNSLLIISSCYFMLHHVILNGIVWFFRWELTDKVFFSIDDPSIEKNQEVTFGQTGNHIGGNHKHYDNMDYI